MSSLPVSATANETRPTLSRAGDATVVRGVAAFLVLLALVALLVMPAPVNMVAAAASVALGVALFAAAAWRRAPDA